MTGREVEGICQRHGIPRKDWAHFSSLVLHGQLDDRQFGRRIRKNFVYVTCLEEMKDVLSLPYRHLLEPDHFESLT